MTKVSSTKISILLLNANIWLSGQWHDKDSWLPYSTDFIFVFVSWVGGGNPPRAVPKCLRPHCGWEKQAGDDCFAKYPCHAYKYESHAKKLHQKKLKPAKNSRFFRLTISSWKWGASLLKTTHGFLSFVKGAANCQRTALSFAGKCRLVRRGGEWAAGEAWWWNHTNTLQIQIQLHMERQEIHK